MLLHVVLQVAPGHVQPDGVAKNMVGSVCRLDVLATQTNGHHQLDFMVQVVREAGVGQGANLTRVHHHQRVSRLHEKEGRLAAGVAHFFGVFFIVAADAVNAMHRKLGSTAHHGHSHWGRGVKNIAHGAALKPIW